MTISEASRRVLFELYHDYDNREASNIADWIMEQLTGWKKIDRIINGQIPLSAVSEADLEKYIKQLAVHTPVQYILHEAWFYGLKFFVDKNVLIPRPETEELVNWIIAETEKESSTIIDIGTGSGCIAVTLKKKRPAFIVHACDVSEQAIEVAKKNAIMHDTSISFTKADILNIPGWKNLPLTDIIVSNPPYIPVAEKEQMNKNVILHEPHSALFVTDNDPLQFYRIIAAYAKEKLNAGGSVFVEVHEDQAAATAALFTNDFKKVEIKKDLQGKERMIRAY